MKKEIFKFIVFICLLVSCTDLVEVLPLEKPEVSDPNVDEFRLTSESSIISSGDGIVRYGHVWSETNASPIVINNDGITVHEEDVFGSLTFIDTIILAKEEEQYFLSAYIEDVHGRTIYSPNARPIVKRATFERTFTEFKGGRKIVSLSNGSFVIGGDDFILRLDDFGNEIFRRNEIGIDDIIEVGDGNIVILETKDDGLHIVGINSLSGVSTSDFVFSGSSGFCGEKIVEVQDDLLGTSIFAIGSADCNGQGSNAQQFDSYVGLINGSHELYPEVNFKNAVYKGNLDFVVFGNSSYGNIIVPLKDLILPRIELTGDTTIIDSILWYEGILIMGEAIGTGGLKPSSNGVILAGCPTYQFDGDGNGFVQTEKFNYNLTESCLEYTADVEVLSDGSIVLVGWDEGIAQMKKMDLSGKLVWQRSYKANSIFLDIESTNDGGFISTGIDGGFLYVVKTNEEGFVF